MHQQFLNLIRGTPGQLPPPVDNMDEIWSPYEKTTLIQQFGEPIVGDRDTVKIKLEDFLNETQADELMIHTQIFDHHARLKSYDIVADALRK
jgi:alkanesulfonate monooxygenase SsuD/methylene tetrahydromethanopterin reductase-like flavin-dependent oxidoreductase (luciferase family)